MPAKNSVKIFVQNGYYHLYNRGVEKRKIFLDKQDYHVFLEYLDHYLNPNPKNKRSDPHPLSNEIDLIAYCLMPNHFHLLVKQKSHRGITKLIRSLCTKYVLYFNNKYERVGTLFQGKYKASLVDNDAYLLHVSRYIHLNPRSDPKKYPFSSYSDYIGFHKCNWVKPKAVLDFFSAARDTRLINFLTYESFVKDFANTSESNDFLFDL